MTYSLGVLAAVDRPDNPEGKRLFPDDAWLDSSGAIEKMVLVGFDVPTEADPYTWVNATLEMYGGDDPVFAQLTDPIWRVSKVTQAPGMEVVGEEWWVAALPDLDDAWLVCDFNVTESCYVLE